MFSLVSVSWPEKQKQGGVAHGTITQTRIYGVQEWAFTTLVRIAVEAVPQELFPERLSFPDFRIAHNDVECFCTSDGDVEQLGVLQQSQEHAL